MSLIIDGTTIPNNGNIKLGNSNVEKVICNGVEVWKKIVFETKTLQYTGGMQSVDLPPGLYKMEVWGASGGRPASCLPAGNGGYSCRYFKVSSTITVYVCVGGTAGDSKTGGYNGGGNGGGPSYGGGGGGATHIATANGQLSSLNANKSAIIVVAGGGGGGGNVGTGGSGGGLSGGNGIASGSVYGTSFGCGGTQSAPGNSGESNSGNGGGGFGYGGSVVNAWDGAGGGGGYYGGGYGTNYNGGSPGGGGSGYIGVSSITHGGKTYTNTSSNGVNSGHGKATITFVES